MSLSVTSVPRLAETLPAVEAYLGAPAQLFETRHLVVPTLGVRAWLSAELATRLGSSGRGDGVVANVRMHLPGSLRDFLADRGGDPWSIPSMTWMLLDVLVADARFAAVVERAGGPLLAARAMADRFDRYHARRPAMIRDWEAGAASLGPTANDPVVDGFPLAAALAVSDRWQFDLWREVRARIGEPSPPARPLVRHAATPDRLLVVGLQTLTPGQMELVTALGDVGDVRLVLVHPSPALAARRRSAAPIGDRLTPLRAEPSLDPEVDPLVQTWLRDSEESHALLAARGIGIDHSTDASSAGTSLLARMQHTVRAGLVAAPVKFDANDHSLLVHRCHDLGRQVEVLRDALLHAASDLPGLAPHDVVILCPDVAAAAPFLASTFRAEHDGEWSRVVVADRGLREVSSGATVLATLLDLVGSRYGLAEVLELAGMPLVLDHLGVSADAPDTWARHLESARVRWGLDVAQRQSWGLTGVDSDAHTWALGLERMVLGALVPDGGSVAFAGEVSPLADVEGSELDEISALLVILRILSRLEQATSIERPVADWVATLEESLVSLCGSTGGDVEPALRVLAEFAAGAGSEPVPFHDVRALLAEALAEVPGRQPLRTGSITATSMIPLRGVPFRVVCVLGFDEAALAVGEGESDDLTERLRLVGDRDARHEVRRGLLDAMLAAGDRLIVTCTGRDVRNNQTKHLATPLAEFVDFAVRHGAEVVTDPDGTKRSAIEVVHPRHATSRANFLPGAVLTGRTWSHSATAMSAAAAMGGVVPPVPVSIADPSPAATVTVEQLETLVANPLALYAHDTLGLRRRYDGDEVPGAVIPLGLTDRELRALAEGYMQRLVTSGGKPNDVRREWIAETRRSAAVPLGAAGDDSIAWVTGLVEAMFQSAAGLDVALGSATTREVSMQFGATSLVGRLGGVLEPVDGAAARLLDVDFRSTFDTVKAKLGVRLLLARAMALESADALSLMRHAEWPNGTAVSARVVFTGLDAEAVHARLAKLVALARFALTNPCPTFGSTVRKLAEGDDEGARKAFSGFVGDRYYPGSYERRVYGPSPEFDDVFRTDSPEYRFTSLSGSLPVLTYRPGGKRGTPQRFELT